MTEQQKRILAQAKIVAESYQCPWEKKHLNAIEDFWLMAQDDLRISDSEKTDLPDEIVEQLN